MQLAFKVLNIFRMTLSPKPPSNAKENDRQTCFEICLCLSTCMLGMLIFFSAVEDIKIKNA